MTLDELPGYLMMLAARAGEAAIPAADKLGRDFESMVIHRLTEKSHRRGTRTPAPPGGPPAMESGALAGSVNMTPASTPVVATATVGPRLPPRDYVQEFGGSMNARPGGRMIFVYGDLYRARHVDVPAREYMVSSAEIVAHDPAVAAAVAAAFYGAIWG